MTNEITTPRGIYKLQMWRTSIQKLRGIIDQNTRLGQVRNGEVRQIRAGVRGCFHPHLQPSYRRLVQAVHRAELLFRRESLGFAVRDPEVAVCTQI